MSDNESVDITDEAVEAAARAHVGPGDTAWDDLTPMVRRLRIQKMRAALEAAAPHMHAEWEEARKRDNLDDAYDSLEAQEKLEMALEDHDEGE